MVTASILLKKVLLLWGCTVGAQWSLKSEQLLPAVTCNINGTICHAPHHLLCLFSWYLKSTLACWCGTLLHDVYVGNATPAYLASHFQTHFRYKTLLTSHSLLHSLLSEPSLCSPHTLLFRFKDVSLLRIVCGSYVACGGGFHLQLRPTFPT